MTLYKVLDAEGCSCNGGELKWSLPARSDDGSWTPGEWMPEIEGPLVECENGYHLATLEQLPLWLNERIFVAEVDGELIESSDGEKWVARKVRLVAETNWNERIARLFACDCAESDSTSFAVAGLFPYQAATKSRCVVERGNITSPPGIRPVFPPAICARCPKRLP